MFVDLADGLVMGHYQEEGIGVKGFMSNRGSILRAPEGWSRSHEEISGPMTDFDNVILCLQLQ